MNHIYIRELITREVREKRVPLPEAARMIIRNLGGTSNVQRVVRDVIGQILEETSTNCDWTTAPHAQSPWYTGVEPNDKHWPAYVDKMKEGSLADAVEEIDRTTHEIVSRIADPTAPGTKKKGLVLGYVQSGKTANYSGVISKSADTGYQLIIVLAGMHNNLRRQTQVRLEKDLLKTEWFPLTDGYRDFRNTGGGAALLKSKTKALAVVKKQQNRLMSLRDWLASIPEDVLKNVPVLIIDDEADQATPNTKAASEELSRINELLREIWAAIPTGTYIGYTATPFANVFMDPNDDRELYPSDFITSLPMPNGYFGAERLFGNSVAISADDEEGIVDAIRYVPEEDSEALRPPTEKEERQGFEHGLPRSLQNAVQWFLVATAIRHARGQGGDHSSMLIHTTHYTAPHRAMRDAVVAYVKRLKSLAGDGDFSVFEAIYEEEILRCENLATLPIPAWTVVQANIQRVISSCRVVVDNSESPDRLDYDRRDDDDKPIVETVIAIGGGTLSRGLTLEGLVVSYFLRTSSTYDTLLQMGRWFGYRREYEDLPRIWMPADLKQDFEFLAMVEIELREEINRLSAMEMTPRELGIRVRSHPGRLAITSSNKLVHAERTNLSFTGTRLQTFIFDTGKEAIASNQNAVRALLSGKQVSPRSADTAALALFEDLPAKDISDFFDAYDVHEKQTNMPSSFISEWIGQKAGHTLWNVAVMGLAAETEHLGSLEIAPGLVVPAVNRAPLASSGQGEANIKALLSLRDYVADISTSLIGKQESLDAAGFQRLRQELGGGRGLLIVYVVSANSVPTRAPKPGRPPARRVMDAADHMIGLGIVFPGFDQVQDVTDGDFYSVTTDWEVPDGDIDGFPQDDPDDDEVGDALPDEWAWLNADV